MSEALQEQPKLVRFIFRHRGRWGTAVLPWEEGKTIHKYLAEAPLSDYHLLGRLRRRTPINQFKVPQRSGYVLSPGDTITVR